MSRKACNFWNAFSQVTCAGHIRSYLTFQKDADSIILRCWDLWRITIKFMGYVWPWPQSFSFYVYCYTCKWGTAACMCVSFNPRESPNISNRLIRTCRICNTGSTCTSTLFDEVLVFLHFSTSYMYSAGHTGSYNKLVYCIKVSVSV